MYFLFLVTIHMVTAVFWIGGLLFTTFVLLRTIINSESPGEYRSFLKRLVRRFRRWSFGASGLLLLTGLLMLPERSFHEPLRFAALAVMILGWVAMSAMTFGTMPDEAFSGRAEDIEQKEREESNPRRLYRIHLVVSLFGVLILASGAVLAYT